MLEERERVFLSSIRARFMIPGSNQVNVEKFVNPHVKQETLRRVWSVWLVIVKKPSILKEK